METGEHCQPVDETENTLKHQRSRPGSSFLTQTRIDVQSGLYVKATVNGKLCNFLVDTGVNLKNFTHKVYDNITKSNGNELVQVPRDHNSRWCTVTGKRKMINFGNSEFEFE